MSRTPYLAWCSYPPTSQPSSAVVHVLGWYNAWKWYCIYHTPHLFYVCPHVYHSLLNHHDESVPHTNRIVAQKWESEVFVCQFPYSYPLDTKAKAVCPTRLMILFLFLVLSVLSRWYVLVLLLQGSVQTCFLQLCCLWNSIAFAREIGETRIQTTHICAITGTGKFFAGKILDSFVLLTSLGTCFFTSQKS